MTELLVKLFIKNKDKVNINNPEVRTAYGVLSSVVGIVCNVLLCSAKLLLGILISSVSVMADAFNNLSDAASSIISFLGVKLARKEADKEHPFGHGRYEYLAALAVSFLILEVAISSFKSSFEKISNPSEIDLSWVSIVILLISVAVKGWMSLFNRKLGRKINSSVMKAAAADSISDVLVTSATIISLIVGYFTGLKIDGYMGCAVSVMVFIAGIKIAKETIEPLLGQAVDWEEYKQITDKVSSYEGIEGTHDLIVHKYGPSRTMATIHAEVRNDVDIEQIHETIDRIERDVLKDMNILLVIHMDPIEVRDEKVLEKKAMIVDIVNEIEPGASIHDFRVVNGVNQINLVFDVVVPFGYKKEQELLAAIMEKARNVDTRFQCVITLENSYIDESGRN